jgi:hypothetical protein
VPLDESLSEVIRRFSAEMADIENALRSIGDPAGGEQQATASREQPPSANLAAEPE